MLHYSTVVQLLVDFIFSQGMLYVVVFDLVIPTIIKVMDFACYFAAVLEIECLVYLGKSTFAKNWKNQVPIIEHSECLAPVNATILWLLFVPYPLVFNKVGTFLFFKHVQLLLDSLLFIVKEFLLKLINLSLLILVDIIELAFFEIVLAIFIGERESTVLLWTTESICGHRWHNLVYVQAILLLFGLLSSLLELFNFVLFLLDFSQPRLQLQDGLTFLPNIDYLCTLAKRWDSSEFYALLIQQHAPLFTILVFKLCKVLDECIRVNTLHTFILL